MGNGLSSKAIRLANELGVPTQTVKAFHAKLLKETRSQYLGALNYESTEFYQLVKRAMDTNGDNKIGLYEYIRFLIALQSDDRNYVLKELFRVFDWDGNEFIDINEARQLFAALDQMKARAYNQQRADIFFYRVDTNRDNKITFEEFVYHANRDTTVMHDLEELRTTILRRNP